MIGSNKRQPLNNKILTWDRNIQNAAELNMFSGAKTSPLTQDSVLTAQHMNKV